MPFVGSSIVAGTQAVTKTVYNVPIALINTEQSQVMPTTIVGYLIRTRGNTELKISHVVTESGTKYVTVPRRATHVDDHTFNSLTLYFQSPTAGDIVEIVAWEI
jgi:hypothetical protein